MSDRTKIEWCDATWNPVTGCTPVSAGCERCYAKAMHERFGRRPFSDVTMHPERLEQPFRWRKPRRVFVCSMGDLFHKDVPLAFIQTVFGVMRYASRHMFLVLTKRPETALRHSCRLIWVSNVWLGTSVESARCAGRIETLRRVPASHRFVSFEPLLSPARGQRLHDIHWVICGAETGPGARPMNPDWARDLRDQCIEAGIPFFFKRGSDGSRLLDGREWNEFPMIYCSEIEE